MARAMPRSRNELTVNARSSGSFHDEQFSLKHTYIQASSPHPRCATLLLRVCLLVSILTFTCPTAISAAAAAETPAAAPAPKPPEPPTADPLGRSTPYGTVFGFLRAADKKDYAAAANYLDIKTAGKRTEKLVQDLRTVLNRGLKVGLEDLSRSPEGLLNDGLSVYAEKVGTVTFAEESLDIILRRTTKPDTPPIWLFAPETLLRVASAAEQLDLTWGEALWPESFRRVHALSYPLFQWANVVIGIPVLLLISWLLGGGLLKLLRPAVIRFNQEQGEIALTRVRWLVFLLIFAVLLRIVAMNAVTVGGRIVLGTAGNVLIIVAISWLLVRITKLATRSRVLRLQRAGMPSSIAAVELTGWLVMCAFFVAGLFLILRLIGVEVTTAVAGLGVGGIAIAFAATKTLENLFGTVTIVTDKPIRVGDTFQAGTTEGTIESIGLRSTRIRTSDRTLVTIPNGQLATMTVGNLSDRDKHLFRHNIRLRYDSTADQLRHVLAEIKKTLLAHPQLEPVSVRTRLTRFSEYSVDLEVFAYVLTRDSLAFLEIQESLLLKIMDIVEASGTSVALPYQTADAGGQSAAQQQRDASANRSPSDRSPEEAQRIPGPVAKPYQPDASRRSTP